MPSLTRLDTLTFFLRVLFVASVPAFLSGLYNFGATMIYDIYHNFVYGWRAVALELLAAPFIKLLIIGLFGPVFAANTAGRRAHETLVSHADLRSLFLSCSGLFLFTMSLGDILLGAVKFIFYGKTSLVTISLTPTFFISTISVNRSVSLMSMPFISTSLAEAILCFFLGFALAFGPAIRDNWRARIAA